MRGTLEERGALKLTAVNLTLLWRYGVLLKKKDYDIIKAHRPMFSKPASRNIKFFINDNFLSFWFRFLFKNKAAMELENYDLVLRVIQRDFRTYAGPFLEKYFRQHLAETKQFSHIGNYWQRGNKNEIDIVAYNELTKRAVIGEVKLNPEQISLDVLRLKAQEITRELVHCKLNFHWFLLDLLPAGVMKK